MVIKFKLRFRRIEIDTAFFHSFLCQHGTQAMHLLDRSGKRCITGRLRLFPFKPVHDRLHTFITEPLLAANNTFDNFVFFHAAARRKSHEHREREAIFIRTKAAQTSRQVFREHGNNAVREIDTGPPFQRFRIQCTARLYKVRYVCNMHTETAMVLRQHFQRNCIVEVFCIFRIYRKAQQPTEIAAAADFILRYGRGI